VSADLNAIERSHAEVVDYHEKPILVRENYTSKAAKYEQQAKEALKREERFLWFEDMASENLISFDKDIVSLLISSTGL
jgi:phage shock protein A